MKRCPNARANPSRGLQPVHGKVNSGNSIGIYGLRKWKQDQLDKQDGKGQNKDLTAVIRYGFGYIQLFVFEYRYIELTSLSDG